MKLSDFIKDSKPSVVVLKRQGEILWRIYSSAKTVLLVPGPLSRTLAGQMFDAQSPGAAAATWKQDPSTALHLLHKAGAEESATMWFAATLDRPRGGKWIELRDVDGTATHGWKLDKPTDAPRLTWRMSRRLASFIAGDAVVGDYKAVLAAQGGSPYLAVGTADGPGPKDVVAKSLDSKTPFFTPPGSNEHRLRWRLTNDVYWPAFTRSFEIAPDSAVGKALGLVNPVTVEAEQVVRGDHWEVRSLHSAPRYKPNRKTYSLSRRFRHVWNGQLAAAAHRALALIKNGAPASIAPLLGRKLDQSANHYVQVYAVRLGTGDDPTRGASFTLERSGYTDADGKLLEKQESSVELTWPSLRSTAGDPLEGESTVSTRAADLQGETQADDGTVFELFIRKLDLGARERDGKLRPGARVRDGALDLGFGGDLPKEKPHYGRLRALLHLRDQQRPLFLFQYDESLRDAPVVLSYAIEELTFRVVEIAPGAQDPRPEDEFLPPATTGSVVQGSGERSEPPLVFSPKDPAPAPADQKDSDKGERLLWIANESTNVTQSMRLDVRLERYATEATAQDATMSVVVIDAAPQLVAEVRTKFLARDARDGGTDIVARRSPLSDERDGWELFDERALTEGFTLVLPAQSLGEQMVKARDDFPEPSGQDTRPAADSRFGPPAHLRLAPERLDRGFVSVAWNLRRLVLERGSPSPGIPLLEADFELLYGLAAHVEHPGLLVTELGSKLGELPTPALPKQEWTLTPLQRRAYHEAWKKYLSVYRAWLTRLCVLEVSHEDEPLRPLTLTEGVDYRARVDVAKTTEGGLVRRKGARLAWPQPRGREDKKPEQRIAGVPEDLAAYHTDDGLKGGAFWGFDQLEIYREFWRHHRRSSSGEIADLAFTSLGGYGKQTARFVGDKTTIRSVTSLGRTNDYAVERLGRIAVCWNKAKHVIEYERTAVRSKQFAEQQPAHAGRVLCRRVREYVEVLEQECTYPDGPGHDPSAPGAVRAAVFRTRIFPVDSSWGRTVYRNGKAIGWEIPLWREGLDPAVYPKPQVSLHLTPPADADVEVVPADLERPQVLYFFTPIEDKDAGGAPLTADVRSWPAVASVDYVDQPDPQIHDIAPCAGPDAEGMDVRLPGPPEVPPGFERFTFQVEPSDLPADVAGAYFKDAKLSGRMRSVTLMRSAPAQTGEGWWEAGGSETAKAARAALKKLIVGDESLAAVTAVTANGFATLLDDLRAGRRSPASVTLNDFRAKATDWLEKGKDAIAGIEGKLAREPRADNFKTLYEETQGSLTLPGKALWREVLEGADGVVERAMAQFEESRAAFLVAAARLLDRGQRGEPVAELVRQLEERVTAFPVRLQWQLSEAFVLARSHVAGLSKKVVDGIRACIRNEVLDRLAKIQEETVPEQLEAARERIKADIRAAAGAAAALASKLRTAKLDQARTRLLAKIEQFRGAAVAAVVDVIDTVDAINGAFAAQLRGLEEELAGAAGEIVGPVETEARASIDAAESALRSVHAEVVDLMAAPLQVALDPLRKTAGNLDLGAEKIKQELADGLKGLAGTLRETLVREIKKLLYPGTTTVFAAVSLLDEVFRGIGSYFASLLEDLGVSGAAGAAKALFDRLGAATKLADALREGDVEAIAEAAGSLAEGINREIGELAGQVAELARDVEAGQAAAQAASDVLRNARSVWDEFAAPGLGFNRRTVEMVVRFDAKRVDERLGLTPTVARVKQVVDRLEEMELRVAVVGVADRLLSAGKGHFEELTQSHLGNFGFSAVMSAMASLRMPKLFPGLKFPQLASDDLRITHGFDKERLKTWIDAESDIRLDGRKTLLSVGPVQVTVTNARFAGKLRLETDIRGAVKKVARGSMRGDWAISVGGTEFMTYEDLRITFEDGKLDFDLDPSRMRSPGLLRLMTDVSQTIPFEGGSFNFGMLKDGQMPVGLRADLELGPFGGSGGVSGISNLLFGAFFEVRLLGRKKPEFSLATGFHLGKRESPFDLQVFILGGGGYFDLALSYTPGTGAMAVDVSLAVHASASLRIDVGWLRGGVAIYLGLEAQYHKRPSTRPAFHASQFVMIEGYVRVVSLVTVHLTLRLACTFATIPGGTELRGSGTVSVRVRISRFFKVSVHRSYESVIARSGGSGRQKALAGSESNPIAKKHIEMLAP